MSVPLTATHRVVFNYTVDAFPHKLRLYTKVSGMAGDGHAALVLRDSTAGVSWYDGAESFMTLLASLLKSTTSTYQPAILEQRSGTVWNPLDSYTSSGAPASGAGYVKAGQYTLSLRDTAFKKLRVIVLESILAVGFKYPNTSSTGIAALTSFNQWFTVEPAAGDPTGFNWVRSRGDRFPFAGVSGVTDLNDKIRRGRFIA